MKNTTIHIGDCIEVMRGMAENSVDAIVTDPPYELGFMGKAWDASGIANNPAMWREALRVLKPGGHLLAFSGSRTYHRMACSIEDAGFDIRDQIMWIYGSGFPKSLDVSKAIDKTGGASVAWFGPWFRKWRKERGTTQKEVAALFPSKTGGLTGCVANWELGLNMPTPEQFNLIRDTFGLPFESIEAAEREVVGQGYRVRRDSIVNLAGSSDGEFDITAPATDAAKKWEGWGTALKPAHEPICVARKPLVGTVAANVLAHGTGALNIDGCRVGTSGGGGNGLGSHFGNLGATIPLVKHGADEGEALGRWPANLIHDGSAEVIAAFPDAKGQQGRVSGNEPTANGFSGAVQYGGMLARIASAEPRAEIETSAARFFYCAKTSKADRGANTHPTVKPTDLMAYLCRLVTPPGGTVLDPFMGSGSTGKACVREGFRFIGIELSSEYAAIAQARIEAEQRVPVQGALL